jgi:hypothetical protein
VAAKRPSPFLLTERIACRCVDDCKHLARNHEKGGGRKDAHCPRQVQGSSAIPASRMWRASSGPTRASASAASRA